MKSKCSSTNEFYSVVNWAQNEIKTFVTFINTGCTILTKKKEGIFLSHVAEYNEQHKYECYMLESSHQHMPRTAQGKRTYP